MDKRICKLKNSKEILDLIRYGTELCTKTNIIFINIKLKEIINPIQSIIRLIWKMPVFKVISVKIYKL